MIHIYSELSILYYFYLLGLYCFLIYIEKSGINRHSTNRYIS